MKNAYRFVANARYPFAAALLFLATIALIHPLAEVGMNDDWSYIRTAHDLALTGHLRYNGWSAPLIGFQAYWGALFSKLFGFSFLSVRASAWCLAIFSIPLLWNVFRCAGLSKRQSFFALVMFLLSPLNLPNLLTFMTDMPAFFFFAAALYASMKAWMSEHDKHAYLWACLAALCGIAGGSIRQIYWLCGICFLAVLAFTRLRSLRGRALVIGLILLTLLTGIAASRWLSQQPYVPAETTLKELSELPMKEMATSSGTYLARYFLGAAVLLIPVSLLSILSTIRRLPLWIHLLLWFSAVVATRQLAQPLPWLGNTLSQQGVLLQHTVSVGEKPVLLSATFILIIGCTGLAGAVYSLIHLSRSLRHLRLDTPLGRLTALVTPFLISYLAILALRSTSFGLYDRYLIPVVFIVSTLTLAVYATVNDGIGLSSWIAACIFGLYAVATTHDYFAEARAKLRSTTAILQSGHRRQEILSGFEFDSWSQLELTGHLNNELVDRPGDAYRESDDCSGPEETRMWWRTLAPDLRASYVVSLTPVQALPRAPFAPVAYWRWLPPVRSYIYVERADPPLTCGPSTEN